MLAGSSLGHGVRGHERAQPMPGSTSFASTDDAAVLMADLQGSFLIAPLGPVLVITPLGVLSDPFHRLLVERERQRRAVYLATGDGALEGP